MEFHLYIAYCILAIAAIWIIAFGFGQSRSIVEGFKGKDKIWQFIEGVMVIWLILFPTMVVTDPLGLDYSQETYKFMEIIFVAAVTGKVGLKYSENKFKKDGE